MERRRRARLGEGEAAREPRPRLDEVERTHAVHGHVVDARAQHHAAALEERHLRCTNNPRISKLQLQQTLKKN